MAKIKIGDGKIIDISTLFGLVGSKISGIGPCSTIKDCRALLTDIDIGIKCFEKAVIVDGVCRSAIQVSIDALKSELVDAKKKVERKLNDLLVAEAKADMAQLLVQAKKWLGYGYKDVASSYLRAYERLRSKFGIDADPEYESVKLAACS